MNAIHYGYKVAAGLPCNEAVLAERNRLRYNPPNLEPTIPTFRVSVDRRDVPTGCPTGWDPVGWSDYPKQPAWTVPLPKIVAPIVGSEAPHDKTLPCHQRSTEHMTRESCPGWVPDPVAYDSRFHPWVDKENEPFYHLQGPPTLKPPEGQWKTQLDCERLRQWKEVYDYCYPEPPCQPPKPELPCDQIPGIPAHWACGVGCENLPVPPPQWDPSIGCSITFPVQPKVDCDFKPPPVAEPNKPKCEFDCDNVLNILIPPLRVM